MIRRVGEVRMSGVNLKLRFPERHHFVLRSAIATLRTGKAEALRLLAEPPPPEQWPESLSDLAAEVGQRSGDPDAARREVWIDWYAWKAAALNRLFQEQGVTAIGDVCDKIRIPINDYPLVSHHTRLTSKPGDRKGSPATKN